MNDECEGMAYGPDSGVVPCEYLQGTGCINGTEYTQSTNFYNLDVDLERPLGECTTNVIGSSVIFECMDGVIMEHVFHDAAQGSVPIEPDCSGDMLYTMPIENGCNAYDWGSMLATWDGACMPEVEETTKEPETTEESSM